MPWSLAVGAGAGVLSSLHCAAMCGPLVAAQGQRAGAASSPRYLLGRATAYAGLGGAAGGTGQALTAIAGPIASLLYSWMLSAALIVVAARLWRHRPAADPGSAPLAIGRRRRPLVASLISWLRPGPFGFGALTALLPCGALWAALAAAAAAGSAASGALVMTGFALASSGGLVAGGWLAGLLRRRSIGGRRVLAAVIVAGAVIVGLRPITAFTAGGDEPPCHPGARGGSR